MSMALTFSDWEHYADSDGVAHTLDWSSPAAMSTRLAYPYIDAIRQAWNERRSAGLWADALGFYAAFYPLCTPGDDQPPGWHGDAGVMRQGFILGTTEPAAGSQCPVYVDKTGWPTLDGRTLATPTFYFGIPYWLNAYTRYSAILTDPASVTSRAGVSDAGFLSRCAAPSGSLKNIPPWAVWAYETRLVLRELTAFIAPPVPVALDPGSIDPNWTCYVIAPGASAGNPYRLMTGTSTDSTWHINVPHNASIELAVRTPYSGTVWQVVASLSGSPSDQFIALPTHSAWPCIRADFAVPGGFVFQ